MAAKTEIDKSVSTRDRLTAAMIRVIGSDGLHAASVRTIAREAGCNEAVLYQHFPSKAAMLEAIHEEIVTKMADEKSRLVASTKDVRSLIHAWIEVTYTNFDRNPDAFAYALLSFPPVVHKENPTSDIQSRILLNALESLEPPEGFTTRTDTLSLVAFRSLLLGIPREIHLGSMQEPAIRHATSIARMAESILFKPA